MRKYKKVFELLQLDYCCQLLSIHDITDYSIFICPITSGKCGKEREKLQKSEYLENEKSFSEEKPRV